MDAVQNKNLTSTSERKFPPATLDTSLDLPIPKPALEIPWRIDEAKVCDGPPHPLPHQFKEGEVCINELLEAYTSVGPTSLACWKKVANVYNVGSEAFEYRRQDGRDLRKSFNQIIKTPSSCKKTICRAAALAQKSGVSWGFNARRRQPITSTPYFRRTKKQKDATAKETDTAPSTSMSIPSGSNFKENKPITPASKAVETEDRPGDKEKTIAKLREKIETLEMELSVSSGRRQAVDRATKMIKRNNDHLLCDMKKLYDKIAKLEDVIKDLEGFASDPHYDPSKNKRTAEPANDRKVLHRVKRIKTIVPIDPRRSSPLIQRGVH